MLPLFLRVSLMVVWPMLLLNLLVCFREIRRVLWVDGTLTRRRNIPITWTTRRRCQSTSALSDDLLFWWWRWCLTNFSVQGGLPVWHQDVWGQKDSALQRDQRESRTGPTVEEDKCCELFVDHFDIIVYSLSWEHIVLEKWTQSFYGNE